MCNRTRLGIDLVIDYQFFKNNRNRNRIYSQKNNRNQVKKSRLMITNDRKF